MPLDAAPEDHSLASYLQEQLRSLSGVSIEVRNISGKDVLICDYEPVWFDEEDGSHDTAQQRQYRSLLKSLKEICDAQDFFRKNAYSAGVTDMVDVRMVRDPRSGMIAYLMPRPSWNRAQAEGFHLRDEPVRKALSEWAKRSPAEAHDPREEWAADALAGDKHAQIVPIAAGLRPLAVELSPEKNPYLKEFVTSTPGIRWVQEAGRRHPSEMVYKPSAVQKVLAENADIFQKIGLPLDDPDRAVRTLAAWYEGRTGHHHHGHHRREEGISEAFGLLLGYDRTSCLQYHGSHDRSEDEQFMPPDEFGAHRFNPTPFTYYDIDYIIHEPDANPDFKALRARYDALPHQIAEQLKAGTSPLGVLRRLAAGSESADAPAQVAQSIIGRLRNWLKM